MAVGKVGATAFGADPCGVTAAPGILLLGWFGLLSSDVAAVAGLSRQRYSLSGRATRCCHGSGAGVAAGPRRSLRHRWAPSTSCPGTTWQRGRRQPSPWVAARSRRWRCDGDQKRCQAIAPTDLHASVLSVPGEGDGSLAACIIRKILQNLHILLLNVLLKANSCIELTSAEW
ncbi:hypothetical protein CDAR_31981 [Caerostris darwini]|uniref:Uncharacterized protein n=1 Tax=Caerostris darwini TaxID=1538125 RepID=A0AAV4RQJ5_9ARAC|nr:hypothetical protein CDAR_31981 [Caerostris darwini]